MNKHTPGPWRLFPPSIGKDANWHITDEADTFVAHVYGFDHEVDHQSRINARLIAAAPQLLEALRMWVDIHDSPAGFAGKYGKALDDAIAGQQAKVDAAVGASRAAIAQACGQEGGAA